MEGVRGGSSGGSTDHTASREEVELFDPKNRRVVVFTLKYLQE